MTLHVNNFLSWVQVRDVYVNDSGTWKRVRELYTNNGGTWTLVFFSGLEATLTAGQSGGGANIGFRTTSGFGSLSPQTMEDGRVVRSLYWSSADSVLLEIDGFSSDPGATYLGSVEISSFGTLNQSSALYSYGAGAASWTWSFVGQPFVNGFVYTIIIRKG